MAVQTGLPKKKRQQDPYSPSVLYDLAENVLADTRVGGVGKLSKGGCFKLVSLVFGISQELIRRCLLEIDP